MKTALLELAHSCETEEPHALLDAAIHAAVFGAMDLVDALPAYTTSLDAAVTLVPEGKGFMMRSYGDGVASAIIENTPHAAIRGVARVASGAALALCAAALRARAEALP